MPNAAQALPPFTRTPTLCIAQSRGFVFILRSFAPSARDVAAEVEHHRKATAALLLPSAALEPKVGRVWRKTGAVSLCRRPVFLSRGTQRSLRRRVRLSVARRVAVVAAFQFLERMCRFKLRFKLHSAGRWDRSSPSSSLSAQFNLSDSSLAVTSRGGSRYCEPSSSFARRALSSKSWQFLPKSCAVRVEISGFFSRRCGAASHLLVLSRHSAWRCAKKSPAVCLTAGECRLRRAPQGAWRGVGLALGAGAPCPVRNAIYLFSLGRIEWCRADPDFACFYCEGRNPRSNYLRLRS